MIAPFFATLLQATLTLLLTLLPHLQQRLGTAAPDESALRDESAQFFGVCFVAAAAHAGPTIVLRSAEQLRLFHRQLAARCRRPIQEPTFDFSNGRILFGRWSAGEGCGAHHVLTAYEREPSAQYLRVEARFVPFGSCPYELLRPLWLSAPGGAATRVELHVTAP
ncbi:MAG: hypothetical protein OXG09_05615 [Chloroflexi bacterium]|nr:hypothetical protein [Chloroflexota bacterium]